MQLAQAQLNMLQACPRRFQHVYLDQIGGLPSPELQERLNWGSQFHLLMQQREMGLPIAPPTTSDDPLQQCVTALMQAAPDLFQSHDGRFRQSEHRRTLEFEGHVLITVYDLLILEQQQAQILDWKTYPRPRDRQGLEQDWQTRLYPFVLAETSDYPPEQIVMTYWFVQVNGRTDNSSTIKPQSLQFRYNSRQHEQTRQELSSMLKQLDRWLQAYQAGEPFPQVAAGSEQCHTCDFNSRCQRHMTTTAATPQPLPQLADIPELAI
jgi:hypothetical protein